MSFKAIIRNILNTTLRPFGYCLTSRLAVLSWDDSLQRFQRLGFLPNTIIDIGVARGTPDLYRNFHDAYYLLIDPLRESVPYMKSFCDKFVGGGEFHNIALGDIETEIDIEVRPDLGGSTLFEEIGSREILTSYPVSMKRFDTLIGDRQLAKPCLCKIDVQGAELKVLKGMGEALNQIDMFIVETSFIQTLKNIPDVYDIIAFFHLKGYVLLDILGIVRRPLDRLACQADLVFIQCDNALRADKRWEA